jgi:type IV secretion system protein VirB4
MLNIGEYRRKGQKLADHLPWVALIAPGVVLTKDGGFQRTFQFRGPDLESATEAELMGACARLNNVLKRLGSGWAAFFSAERIPALEYPASEFPDAASWLVDEERRAAFSGENQHHFENSYHLTLFYMPPPDNVDRLQRAFLETATDSTARNWRDDLGRYVAETDRILDLLSGVMPEIRALDDTETLTFLHATVSEKRHPVQAPAIPVYLDGILADTPLTGGIAPKLGSLHLRTLTILGFPNTTRPGLLDALNHLDLEYRWVSRFICLDKTAATGELTKLRRQWFAKRKSITMIIREVMTNETAPLVDSDADNKTADADMALQVLGADLVAFGYLTTTVTVWDSDAVVVDEKVRAVERTINSLGFTTIRETVNAVEAWLGSLPGHVYANVRQPLVHTLNLAHLIPLSAVWAGPVNNNHLQAPPLLYAEAVGSTPFRLSTHVGDVGHMLIVGPTGAGKSVFLSLMALQFRRYTDAQVYIFDKGYSARAAVLAMGGAHQTLGADGTLAFQPLRHIDQAGERSWAAEWVWSLLAHENVQITPEIKETVWSALINLSSAPPIERTLTGLSVLLQSNALRSALSPYTLEGPFGRLLDAAEDRFTATGLQCFETEPLLHEASAVLPVLTYLFHRLEARFDGKPTLLILDEAWVYLDNPLFAARIREWLKVLRKRNVSVVFATQSLADITRSTIAPAIIESCPQRIFLPNERVIEPQSCAAYDSFGLNERQIELVASAVPKRQYYLQSSAGNRLFELDLGPVALALCGSSSAADQAQISHITAEARSDFAERFLRHRGLAWAADFIAQHFNSEEEKAA